MAEIITLAGKFKNSKELQTYADAQFLALKSATEQIEKLKQEVAHLQDIIAQTVPLVGDNKVDIIIQSTEQSIIEAQIKILSDRALKSELTLEEVKVLDLLIKNKKLLSDEPTTITGERKKKREYTEAELISKAKMVEDKSNG